jgi:hypothetical protein
MLRLSIPTWKRKCPQHPRFDPAKHGRGAVKGACPVCTALCDVVAAALALRMKLDTADFQLSAFANLQTEMARRRTVRREVKA